VTDRRLITDLTTAPYDHRNIFASSVELIPPPVLTVSQITNFQTSGETSREVAKRPGIETSKNAKRPGGELAK